MTSQQPSANPKSVTMWIAQLKAGHSASADRIWERYGQRLQNLAKSQLQRIPSGVVDAEDAAQNAFKSLCLGLMNGRFPKLRDRDNLWALLSAIATNKARDMTRRERVRRGHGKLLDEQAYDQGSVGQSLNDLASPEPGPASLAQMAEEYSRLLDLLRPELRAITELKMLGCTNSEIAARLDTSLRTIERRLDLIRRTWEACASEVN